MNIHLTRGMKSLKAEVKVEAKGEAEG